MKYFEIKTDKGFCWLKTDLKHLSADKVYLSLRLDNIIENDEVLEYIKPRQKGKIGEFNLRWFTYSYNDEASL